MGLIIIYQTIKTIQKRGHNLPKFYKMTHIKSKFSNRPTIYVVQYTSASSERIHILSNPSAAELCNIDIFLK